ncbi:proprotein convertase P-domain-containing protein [Altibacter sp. HG106]|uniref:proprotein convertase P-domain-containing protein n=1 Tax=Altibacter sp. HG106 TaxID=3023937 RepID=UPI0023505EA4|nr:proprotein convertase P-domain-containing protein [Altibacter sp. HG106]MDC7995582.1 proprotein convertase P-domain-containing protein [Altibacter sp. HG106]
MKRITLLWCFLFCLVGTMSAQIASTSSSEKEELQAAANRQGTPQATIGDIQAKLAAAKNHVGSIMDVLSEAEATRLRGHFRMQNRNPEADIIPTAGATETFTPATGDFFFDPGGPGGANSDGTPGNYPNCGCITVTTLEGVDEIDFIDYGVNNTFDWLVIYDGTSTADPVIFDSRPGDVDDLAELIAEFGGTTFSGTSGDLTFEFSASAVINYLGWEIEILSAGGGGGGGGGGTGPTDFYVAEIFPATAPFPFGTTPIAGPYAISPIGPGLNEQPFADDFDGSGTLYALDFLANQLITVDTSTGTSSVVGPLTNLLAAHTVTGLSWDFTTDTMYASSTDGVITQLYSVDLSTGTLTTIGSGTGNALGIWLAIDNDGNAFMADIGDDSLYSVDLTTGTSTVIGALGIDISFAQDVAFDHFDNTLYMGGYLFSGDSNVYIVDTATGATTLVYNTAGSELGMFSLDGVPGGGGGGPCDTYDSAAVPFDIDGGATTTADCAAAPNLIPVNVPDSNVIGGSVMIDNVMIDIAHTWSGDLEISLVSPAGTELLLSDNNSGNTDDAYNGTMFQDGGADITAATAPYGAGPYAAEGGSFAATFAGEDTAGDWQLKICDTASGDSGTVNAFSITFCPTNDLCDNAYDLTCGDVVTGSTALATDSGGNAAPDVFYAFTGSGSQEAVTLSLCDGGTDYDSVLRVFTDCTLTEEVASNDDSCGLQSELTFISDGTSTYYVMVEGFSTASGNFSLEATCGPVTEDFCEGAIELSCGDTVTGNTSDATVDNSPVCATGITSPGEWYVFTDDFGFPSDYVVSLCDGGTDYDSKLTVYTGDCGDLVCVTDNDDSCGLQSEVTFTGDGNSTYYILVHGFGGATGNYSLNVDCIPVPPPNDMIVNSIDVDDAGVPYTDPGVVTPAATTEGGVPTDCDISGAAGVWYNITPFGDGTVTATIDNPSGTSVVIWFEAPDENATEDDLVLVDQTANQCLPGTETTINTTAGQTYYVFVVNSGDATDIIIDGENLSTADNTIQGFDFYPNPANDMINLRSVEPIESAQVFNIVGQKVIDLNVNATSGQLNVSQLPVGAYIMQVSVNGQLGTYKIIKQ